MLAAGPLAAAPVTNSVLGGIGGIDNGTLIGGDGTGTGQFTIDIADLALVKQARDLSGNVLPDGSDIPSGQEIFFVFFVDNFTAAPAFNITLIDPINESQFTYIDGTLAATAVPSGSSDAAIWGGTWTTLSQDPDGDIGSIVDTQPDGNRDRITVGNEPSQPNARLDIPTGTLQAFRFRVRVN